MNEFAWVCPRCRSASLPEEASSCPRCAASFPRIGGLPIFARDPEGFLPASVARARGSTKAARERAALVESVADSGILEASLTRLRRVASVQLTNAAAFEGLMAPVDAWLTAAARAPAPAASVPNLGWSSATLLPYLLRDWACRRERALASAFVSSAIDRHLPADARGRLAVLGCGAGGLLADLAPRFAHAVGLELSLPTLLVLCRLRDGGSFTLQYPVATAVGVEVVELPLAAPPGSLDNVSFALADARETPLAAGSIDCVLTPFLLDVIEDPDALAREVHRLLGPSGVWISYGPSNSLNALRRFDAHELRAFVERAGFSVVESANHRRTFLDLREVDESTHFRSHVCYLSVAREPT